MFNQYDCACRVLVKDQDRPLLDGRIFDDRPYVARNIEAKETAFRNKGKLLGVNHPAQLFSIWRIFLAVN
jgi:hypothetical protein